MQKEIYADQNEQWDAAPATAAQQVVFTLNTAQGWSADRNGPGCGVLGNGVAAPGGYPAPGIFQGALLFRAYIHPPISHLNPPAQYVGPWLYWAEGLSIPGPFSGVIFIINDDNRGDNLGSVFVGYDIVPI